MLSQHYIKKNNTGVRRFCSPPR